jgi:hypothetical protein
MNPILYAFLSENFKKSFMKAFTCAKTKEINAQLQVENSFFPRFGRSRNSECFSSKPTTNLVSNINMTSKLNQSTKFGNTVESILDANYNNNGHENGQTTNGHHNNSAGTFLSSVNSPNGIQATENDSCDEDEQEMGEDQQNDNSICIINSNADSRPAVLHTDL